MAGQSAGCVGCRWLPSAPLRTVCRTGANLAYDYGMIWIDAAPGNALGWLGTLWNASTSGRTWTAIGYPAEPNPPFEGNTMDEATGQYGGSDESGTFILSNDNMSHGSSGGAWITTWNGSSPTRQTAIPATSTAMEISVVRITRKI